MATKSVDHLAPLVVITGPTASGKTSLAIRLAVEYGGEIICADSRTVYKGMDIGTAKPTPEEQEQVRHWGLDLVNPDERFSVSDFQSYATSKIVEIRSRGKIPFLVGGTGLYIDAVLYDFTFPEVKGVTGKRQAFEAMTTKSLYEYCTEHNIDLPRNFKNKRHLINAILRVGTTQQRRQSPIENSIVVGITTEKEILLKRIRSRGTQLFVGGALDEARALAATYGWDSEAMTGNIYPLIHDYIRGELTLEQAIERYCLKDWHLAKRQLTWLKRNEHMLWLSLDDAYTFIAHELASVSKI